MGNATCSELGCDKKVIARGLCAKHYQQAAKAGLPPLPPRVKNRDLRCSVVACTNPVLSRGLCGGHYNRLRSTGDVQADVPLQKKRRGYTEECSARDCTEPQIAKGLCKKHYMEARQERLTQDQCRIGGCDRPRGTTDGLCHAHYQRLVQYGDPLAGPPMRRERGTATTNNGGTRQAPEYYVNHRMVRRERGAAWKQACEHCGQQASDWAQVHGTSGERAEDYMPLCKSCHHAYDGLIANLPHLEGETHPQAKLTEATVREIRARHAAGEVGPDLAREYAAAFGVTTWTISNVIHYRTWKNVA